MTNKPSANIAALQITSAPSTGGSTPFHQPALLPYPISVMGMLLAGIHAKHRLIDVAYGMTAVVWTAAVTLVLAPLKLSASSLPRESAIRWVRIGVLQMVLLHCVESPVGTGKIR